MIVLVKPKISETSRNGSSVTRTEKETATFVCDVIEGNPEPYILWKKDNNVIKNTTKSDPNLVLTNIGKDSIGTYVCEARNEAGEDSYSTYLSVRYAPVISTFPQNTTVIEGSSATMDCRAEGNPSSVTYTWTDSSGADVSKHPSQRFTVYYYGSMEIQNVERSDAGVYTCEPANAIGTGQNASTHLDVQYKPSSVYIQPYPIAEVNLNGNISLTCISDGKPLPDIIWTFGGSEVFRGNCTSGKTYDITSAGRDKAGKYTCEAQNAAGSLSNDTTLHVRYLSINRDSSTPSEIQVCFGIVHLACVADGQPTPLNYEWFGTDSKSVSTQNDISFNLTEHSQLGVYKCVVKNEVLSAEHTTNISYIVAPKAPVINNNETDTNSITLSWTVPGAVLVGCHNTFTVKWRRADCEDEWSFYNTTEETYTISGLKPGTEYDIRISTWNKASSSEATSTVLFNLKTKQVSVAGYSPSLSCLRKDNMKILVCEERRNAHIYEFARVEDTTSRESPTYLFPAKVDGDWKCRAKGLANWDQWSDTINTDDCEEVSVSCLAWKAFFGVFLTLFLIFVVTVIVVIFRRGEISPCLMKNEPTPSRNSTSSRSTQHQHDNTENMELQLNPTATIYEPVRCSQERSTTSSFTQDVNLTTYDPAQSSPVPFITSSTEHPRINEPFESAVSQPSAAHNTTYQHLMLGPRIYTQLNRQGVYDSSPVT